MTQVSTTDSLFESEDQLFRQAQQDDFDRQVAEEHEQMVKYRDAWYAVINAIGNVPNSGVLDEDTQLQATLKMIAKLKDFQNGISETHAELGTLMCAIGRSFHKFIPLDVSISAVKCQIAGIVGVVMRLKYLKKKLKKFKKGRR